MKEVESLREGMIVEQVIARGVHDPLVLEAMGRVPREIFVPEPLIDLSYSDSPLPIAAGQTISQPYIVALMVEALLLKGGEKVLEIGAGSGYAAAVLAEIAKDVYTVERIEELARSATANLTAADYANVHVLEADGTRGWAEHAPFDAILVSAGAPSIPEPLKQQLAIGGRLVIPVGADPRAQELIRITRKSQTEFDREDLADVRFVPLIGEQGWESEAEEAQKGRARVIQRRPTIEPSLPAQILQNAYSFTDLKEAPIAKLVDAAAGSRVVLIGEATHGTSEFYRLRAALTRRLIAEKGFNIVAAEADWPDAARIDNYVRHKDIPPDAWTAFSRFPAWMWRNEETRAFVDWLHRYNEALPYDARTAFYGLDLYSLYVSASAVVDYLEARDPALAEIAKARYGCLTPWEADPAAYGHATLTGSYRKCEGEVARVLIDLFKRRQSLSAKDGERYFDALQNARLVADAERYYRIMYYGSRASWNLRDSHMFETLLQLVEHRREPVKAVIWAHNSHAGNALATEMSSRGEYNLGQLCKAYFGNEAFLIGFGTHDGTVAAAHDWDGPMEIMSVRPAHPQSYEHNFHLTNLPGLILRLRSDARSAFKDELSRPRLERAIGVIYRPDSELASHYFEASLPTQFDAYIWVDHTNAITPLATEEMKGMPDTYPFGL
ncbi:MAG: protein-L-isoaspartate(D-aspartate) O-methyltransferase [Rhodomicrobium sp.]